MKIIYLVQAIIVSSLTIIICSCKQNAVHPHTSSTAAQTALNDTDAFARLPLDNGKQISVTRKEFDLAIKYINNSNKSDSLYKTILGRNYTKNDRENLDFAVNAYKKNFANKTITPEERAQALNAESDSASNAETDTLK